MSVKLCIICGRQIEDNDRIYISSLTTYMRHQVNLRFEKFKTENIYDIQSYDINLVHNSCINRIEKELDSLCGDKII